MALTPEDLQAIGSLIQNSIQPLRDDIQIMKNDIQIIKEDIHSLDERLQNVESRITHMELTLENETNHNIQLLAENHINLVDKLNEAIRVQDKSLLYEVQVSGLKARIDVIERQLADIIKKIA